MSTMTVPTEPRSARLVLTLTLAGLLSGLAIVTVYEATLPTITAYQARMLREAVFQVVPGSTAMQPVQVKDGRLVAAESGAESSIFGAYDSTGKFLGYALAGEGPGFQDTIKLLFGFDPARRVVVGMQVLESRETPGLGDKIFKDPAFAENFRALAIEPELKVVKTGMRAAPHEIDGITGATISSKAVAKIIGATCGEWVPQLPAPGQEPALAEPEPEPEEGA